MKFAELSEDQRRRLVDARQTFEAWRTADREFRHSYRGSMRWKRVGGKDYLYRTFNQVATSLGPRGPETERIKDDYTEQRTRLRRRATSLDNRLKEMDALNRASNLGRVPEIAARILRKLDAENLLGKHLYVVGTHSLYAYEAASGVIFDTGLTATSDIDLLWDVRRKLSLALIDVRQEGVLGLLRRVDRTFAAAPGNFRAINDRGYYVDFIRPLEKYEALKLPPKLTDYNDDLEAVGIIGLQWLINAPKFDQVVVGTDGRPLWMSCIDPRAFALHKLWISREPSREAVKRRRDVQQAKAVAAVATQYLGLKFEAKHLTALPIELIKGAKELARVATQRGRRS